MGRLRRGRVRESRGLGALNVFRERTCPSLCHPTQRLEADGVELVGNGLCKLREDLFTRHARPVGTLLRHGRITVCDGDNPCLYRKIGALQAIRIAAAVEALMVLLGQRGHPFKVRNAPQEFA